MIQNTSQRVMTSKRDFLVPALLLGVAQAGFYIKAGSLLQRHNDKSCSMSLCFAVSKLMEARPTQQLSSHSRYTKSSSSTGLPCRLIMLI